MKSIGEKRGMLYPKRPRVQYLQERKSLYPGKQLKSQQPFLSIKQVLKEKQ